MPAALVALRVVKDVVTRLVHIEPIAL